MYLINYTLKETPHDIVLKNSSGYKKFQSVVDVAAWCIENGQHIKEWKIYVIEEIAKDFNPKGDVILRGSSIKISGSEFKTDEV